MGLREWEIHKDFLVSRLQRAYRYSELRKLLCRLKGLTLQRAHFLILTCLVVLGFLGLHYYWHSFFFVVRVDGHEVGLVREVEDIKLFIDELMEQCGKLYGMEVMPGQDITFTREWRPGGEEDLERVKEALRRRVSLLTEAVMVTVDGVPVVPVAEEADIETVIDLISRAYVRDSDNVVLLEVELGQSIEGEISVVPPEDVWSAEEVAALLLGEKEHRQMAVATRSNLLSRSGRSDNALAVPAGDDLPVVQVRTVEEVKVIEQIPFETTYRSNSDMYTNQSRVVTPGVPGTKEVVYRITRENGEEVAREKVAQKVLEQPVNQVVERGTKPRFAWPVPGGRITQHFHSRHSGIDIAAPTGTPVLAAESGIVVRSGWGSVVGNYIIIHHGNYWTLYLHNSVNLVSAGQRVSRGQMIARVGSTGRSTGPHLHFEVRRSIGPTWSGWYQHPPVNPLNFLR